MMARLVLAVVALLAASLPAAAQSNCSNIRQGAVLTPGQWNQCFAAKQDTLTFIPLPNVGNARSVIGVPGNASSSLVSIQASAADQVMRATGAGTGIGWGSIDLSKSGAVGSSILGAANGGLGASASSATGVPVFATGTVSFVATMGSGNIARASGSTFTASAFNGTVGATTPSTISGTTLALSSDFTMTGAAFTQSGTVDFSPQQQLTHVGSTPGSATYRIFQRARAGTTAVQSGDTLGTLLWDGYQSGAYRNATAIISSVDAAPSGSFVPSNLLFSTSSATASLLERMRITSAGNLGIGTDTPIVATSGAPLRFLTVSSDGLGANSISVIAVGGNATNTSFPSGSLAFYNSAIGAADKRIAQVFGSTDGATNSGSLSFQTYNAGTPNVWTTISHLGLLTHTGTLKLSGIPSATSPGCLTNDASGVISGGGVCSGGGMPVGGSIGQAPLNSASGTALWRTEPFANISALAGADCTGAVATAISTVIGSIKAVALPTDCLLKVTANDTIPAGVFFLIPCGARIQVDGAAVLTFNGETDDNQCQKFSASGAGAGSGGGTVRGLRFNRFEWWGAAGDCNYGGSCTHDDYGPVQQAVNSAQASNASSGDRAQVKPSCGKGYGVSTGVVATASRNAPLLISGCAPLDGGNSEGGSSIYGRSGFTGQILTTTVSGSVSTNVEIRDLQISSINPFEADACLQVGSAGNTMTNGAGHSYAADLRLSYCNHPLKFGGSVVSFQFDRIWMVMGNNGGASGATSSCIEATPNSEVLSELTFNAIACDNDPNSDASAICLNFHSQGTGGISGTRINDVSCYHSTNGIVIKAEGTSSVADFWCYSCQMDALRVNSTGFSLSTTGSGTLADIVIDKSYATNLAAPFDIFNIDGSAGGTVKNIGIYGPYMAVGGALRGFRITDAQTVQVLGGRIGGTFVNQGALVNNCTGCQVNNQTFSGSVPVYALLSGTTDYSQACNITAGGALAPASVSSNAASGTHNNYYNAPGLQHCPSN